MSEVVDLLCKLVALASVTPQSGEPDETHGEARIVGFLMGLFVRQGIDVERQEVWPGRANVLARVEGRGGPSLIFEAHTDTVEVANMEIEPFSPQVRDGKVFGRGACDNKASLAAMITALQSVTGRGLPPGDITLAATCDEEYRASGVRYLTDHGFRADGGVVGEPTKLKLVIAHKGALRLQIVTRGRAAHSSEPEKGESAIFHMARVVSALEEYGKTLSLREKHPLVQGPTVSVGLISGGQAPNIVPDRCEIVVDRRMVPGEKAEVVEGELRQWLADRLAGVPWEMKVLLRGEGMEAAPDSPIVRRCAGALDRVLGSHVVTGVPFGTDASRLSAAGTPSVVLGPGDIAQAHTALEWVAIEQVEAAVRVYEQIMSEP